MFDSILNNGLDLREYYGLRNCSTIPLSEIEKFESDYNIKLPEDLRDFLLEVSYNWDVKKKRDLLWTFRKNNIQIDDIEFRTESDKLLLKSTKLDLKANGNVKGLIKINNNSFIAIKGPYEGKIIQVMNNALVSMPSATYVDENGDEREFYSYNIKDYIWENFISRKSWKGPLGLGPIATWRIDNL